MNKLEACKLWVQRDINSISQSIFKKAFIEREQGLDEFREVTPPSKDDNDLLPMWGTMWQFNDSCDNDWLDSEDGLQKMADCGFRIYETDEDGYFFGIDGTGYDFYISHWLPLYNARGLKWHD